MPVTAAWNGMEKTLKTPPCTHKSRSVPVLYNSPSAVYAGTGESTRYTRISATRRTVRALLLRRPPTGTDGSSTLSAGLPRAWDRNIQPASVTQHFCSSQAGCRLGRGEQVPCAEQSMSRTLPALPVSICKTDGTLLLFRKTSNSHTLKKPQSKYLLQAFLDILQLRR